MVYFIYDLVIHCVAFLIGIVSRISDGKIRLFYRGRLHIFEKIESCLSGYQGETIWMHCASLGEFEQGRPVLETFRAKNPEVRIVLTFFSPSGYEVQKNYKGVDFVFYLPLDTYKNASRFVDLVAPCKVFFVKYEFWMNYLRVLEERNIPVYLFSALFREDQVFFKGYGFPFRKALKSFRHIFVQDSKSAELLLKIGYQKISVTGDTRFDRVNRIAIQAKRFPEIERFIGDSFCVVAGSTWVHDEILLMKFINECAFPIKYIIAPHEINAQNLERLSQGILKPLVFYSGIEKSPIEECQVLIIDNVGMLSSLYRYGKVAYVGGGFGKEGIHNCLEPAVFGIPVLFGPNYAKYREAVGLVSCGGGFPIHEYKDLSARLKTFYSQPEDRVKTGALSAAFIQSELGATEQILMQSL